MRTRRQPIRTVKIGIKKGIVYLLNSGGGEKDQEICSFGQRTARSVAAAQRIAQNERCTAGRRPEFIPEILDLAEALVGKPDDEQLMNLLRDALGKSRMFEKRYMSELARLEPAGTFLRKHLYEDIHIWLDSVKEGLTQTVIDLDDKEYARGDDIDAAMLAAHRRDVESE